MKINEKTIARTTSKKRTLKSRVLIILYLKFQFSVKKIAIYVKKEKCVQYSRGKKAISGNSFLSGP
jgi:hypothetical protein